MRLTLLITLIASFISFHCIAQQTSEKKIAINGQIINTEDNLPVPYVHIINTSTSQGTASNSEGQFNITMNREDSLLFSAIGFEKYIFTLATNIDTKQLYITIKLNVSSMELQPVKIFAFKSEQSFKQALVNIDVPEEKPNRMEMHDLGYYYGPRREKKASIIRNPISFIQNRLSKKAIEKRKHTRAAAEYDKWFANIYKKYNPELVQRVTNLPEDKVGDFMSFCKLKDSFILRSHQYEIVLAIQKCLKEYTADQIDSNRH